MTNSDSRPIFASTACIKGVVPLTARLSTYRSAGIEAIELGMRVSLSPGDLARLPDLVRLDSSTSEHRTRFLVHNYFPPPEEPFILNLASADPIIRQRSLDLAQQAILLSRQLKAPFYAIHAGFVTDPYGFGKPYFLFPEITEANARQKAFERFIDALSIVNQIALEHGVGLLVENNVCAPQIWGQVLLDRAEEFRKLLEAMESPSAGSGHRSNIGVLLDFGHLNVAAHTLGFDRLDFIEQLTPYIRAFHVHDNSGTHDTHSPVQPGSWVLEVLRRPEFAHLPLVVEAKFNDVTSLSQHLTWLRQTL